MSLLLPDGIEHLADCPYTLHSAIVHALRFLRYQENLPTDEQPPRRIWMDPDRLEAHFKHVERERKRKYKHPEPDDDDDAGPEERNNVELIARGR